MRSSDQQQSTQQRKVYTIESLQESSGECLGFFYAQKKINVTLGNYAQSYFMASPRCLEQRVVYRNIFIKSWPTKIPKRDSHFPKKDISVQKQKARKPWRNHRQREKRRSSSLKLPFKPLFVPRKGHTKKINSTLQKECRVRSQGILESQEFFFRNDLPKQPSTLWCKVQCKMFY